MLRHVDFHLPTLPVQKVKVTLVSIEGKPHPNMFLSNERSQPADLKGVPASLPTTWEGVTQCWSSSQRQTTIHTCGQFKITKQPNWMSVDSGRKLLRAHADTGRTCNTKKGTRPMRGLLLLGDRANHCIAMSSSLSSV